MPWRTRVLEIMNNFTYKSEYSIYSGTTVRWQAEVGNTVLSGSASTVRQAYRKARKAVRRHNKMLRLLNKVTSRRNDK